MTPPMSVQFRINGRALSFSLVLVLALACGASSKPNAESETHFLKCESDQDCAGNGDAVYCVKKLCKAEAAPTTPPDDASASPVDASTSNSTSSDSSSSGGPDVTAVVTDAGSDNQVDDTSAPGTSERDGGAAVSCERYADVTDASSVSITVSNHRARPIGIAGRLTVPVRVESQNPDAPGAWTNFSDQSCGSAPSGQLGGPTIDLQPNALLVPPGDSITVEWNGLVGSTVPFPSQCCEDGALNPCPAECILQREASLGSYLAHVSYAELSDDAAANCTATPDTCSVGDAVTTVIDAPFTLDATRVVSLEVPPDSEALSCEALATQPMQNDVTLRVHNEFASPILLDAPSSCPDYFSVTSNVQATPGTWTTLWCGGSCVGANMPQPTCGECVTPNGIVLAPGATTDFKWPGTVFQHADFPVTCCTEGGCPAACEYEQAAAPGEHLLNLHYSVATQQQADTCSSNPDNCELLTRNGATPTETSLSFDYDPSQPLVEISLGESP
ncbi:MAG TPA: hypothetical protein VHM70_32640 [Polyangiaceae bacterium]|nr:hypothetical protein [Polyangiaceae bacterium]